MRNFSIKAYISSGIDFSIETLLRDPNEQFSGHFTISPDISRLRFLLIFHDFSWYFSMFSNFMTSIITLYVKTVKTCWNLYPIIPYIKRTSQCRCVVPVVVESFHPQFGYRMVCKGIPTKNVNAIDRESIVSQQSGMVGLKIRNFSCRQVLPDAAFSKSWKSCIRWNRSRRKVQDPTPPPV